MYKDYENIKKELNAKRETWENDRKKVTTGLTVAENELRALENKRDNATTEDEYNTIMREIEAKRNYVDFLKRRRKTLPKIRPVTREELNSIKNSIDKDLKEEQRKRAGEIAKALNKVIDLMNDYASITDDLSEVYALAAYLATNSQNANIGRQGIAEAVEDPYDWFMLFTQMYFKQHDVLKYTADHIDTILNGSKTLWSGCDPNQLRYAKHMKE